MKNHRSDTISSGFSQISTTIDNIKHVFVFLQRNKDGNDEANPYEYYTFNINADRGGGSYLATCRLEYGNGVFYPEVEYDSDSKERILNDLMSYAMRKNDNNSGTELNLSNFSSLFGGIYFDLRYQTGKVTRDPKQLIFRYKLNAQVAADSVFKVNAVVLYDKELIIKQVENELLIV